MQLTPVRETLDLLKVEAPESLLVLRLASAFPEHVGPQRATLSLLAFCDDLGDPEGEEVSGLLRSLIAFRTYPSKIGAQIQAPILAEYRLDDEMTCSYQFSLTFIALVEAFS